MDYTNDDIHFHCRYDAIPARLFCNAWVATAVVGSALIGGAVQAYSANKAADAQKSAADKGAALQTDIFNKTQENLKPYIDEGNLATNKLNANLDFLTSPIKMDQSTLEKTPGYQFNLTQGLKATQNSAAARGLGISGAALKGASTFATGLADNTFQNQFNNENTNRTNAFNRLKGLIDVGENAAAGQGTIGADTGKSIAGSVAGGANATAAAYNKTGDAASGVFSNIGGYAAYRGLYGSNTPSSNPANWNISLPTSSTFDGL